MGVGLVAIDLDDTLLNPDLGIAPRCIRAIKAVREQGILVTLATGRMYRSALPYAQQLEMELPLITYQGALVKNSDSGEVLYERPVPSSLAGEIIAYFQRAGTHCHTYLHDEVCMEKLTREGTAYAELAGVEPKIISSLVAAVERQAPMKIMAVNYDQAVILEMEEELKSIYGERLNITRSKPFFLEVMDRVANKGNALQVVAEHFAIPRQEVLAIGDSYNDLQMICWAGMGVAMGNAPPEVKAIADHITLSNEEDGVAEALQQLVLKK